MLMIHTVMSSHPVRGAWIEIIIEQQEKKLSALSHPVRGAWIEILNDVNDTYSNVGRIP